MTLKRSWSICKVEVIIGWDMVRICPKYDWSLRYACPKYHISIRIRQSDSKADGKEHSRKRGLQDLYGCGLLGP